MTPMSRAEPQWWIKMDRGIYRKRPLNNTKAIYSHIDMGASLDSVDSHLSKS